MKKVNWQKGVFIWWEYADKVWKAKDKIKGDKKVNKSKRLICGARVELWWGNVENLGKCWE